MRFYWKQINLNNYSYLFIHFSAHYSQGRLAKDTNHLIGGWNAEGYPQNPTKTPPHYNFKML